MSTRAFLTSVGRVAYAVTRMEDAGWGDGGWGWDEGGLGDGRGVGGGSKGRGDVPP